MKLFRKVIDERQELEMMRVERVSFWIMFFSLIIAIFVQLLVLGFDFEHVAGEFIILLTVAVWATIGYTRCGAWDYFTKPGMKSYVIYSLGGGFIFGLMVPLTWYFKYDTPLLSCLLTFAINFAILFPLLFLTLWLVGSIVKKRQEKLQQEYEDGE